MPFVSGIPNANGVGGKGFCLEAPKGVKQGSTAAKAWYLFQIESKNLIPDRLSGFNESKTLKPEK